MGLDVNLVDENGKVIVSLADVEKQDGEFVLADAIESHAASLPHLSGVDLYGNTIFNRRQLESVAIELAALQKCVSDKASIHLDDVIALIGQCKNAVHTYIKFVGD